MSKKEKELEKFKLYYELTPNDKPKRKIRWKKMTCKKMVLYLHRRRNYRISKISERRTRCQQLESEVESRQN